MSSLYFVDGDCFCANNNINNLIINTGEIVLIKILNLGNDECKEIKIYLTNGRAETFHIKNECIDEVLEGLRKVSGIKSGV